MLSERKWRLMESFQWLVKKRTVAAGELNDCVRNWKGQAVLEILPRQRKDGWKPRARMGSEPAQPKSKNAGCRLCWELRLKVEVLDWRSEKVSQSGGERQRAKSRDSEKLSQDSHLPSTISIDLEQRKNQRSDWEPQYSCPPRKFLDE